MAKQQEFIELFPKYDTDNDGQINSEEFIKLVG
jgi:Ca2+-binding EF-hand superfamily protein